MIEERRKIEDLLCGTEKELIIKLKLAEESVRNGDLMEHSEFMKELREEFFQF